MSDSNHNLGELIDSSRKDVLAQQAKAEVFANQPARPPRSKQVVMVVLMAMLAAVLFTQYPRFSEPYTWPDPATSPAAAEANLIEVIGWIEAYRISQGRYPAVLSQVTLPAGLATAVAESVLVYQTTDTSYTLDWTLPHWRATYDSQTEKFSVEPLAKR
jgi:hypothetical protein